jgi:uncharacterized membrane protein
MNQLGYRRSSTTTGVPLAYERFVHEPLPAQAEPSDAERPGQGHAVPRQHRRHHHGRHSTSAVAEENVRTVARIRARAARRRTFAQRCSDTVSNIAARESTVVIHVIWFGLWIVLNARVLPLRPFDPFPYPLLTTVVSLEAIFLTLFVLASQQRLTQEADSRADLDLQVNLFAEQEMTVVLKMLHEVCEHLGLRGTIDSQRFRELVKNIDIGQLAERVEENIDPRPGDGARSHSERSHSVPHAAHR